MVTTTTVKIVVAGDGNVGKTSLVRRYCEGKFEESRIATIGVDFHTKVIPLETGNIKLSIWDMAGQERFQVMRGGFYRGSRSAALVFDVTDPGTFENLPNWRDEIMEVIPDQRFIIVGNKIDLERVVDPEPAKAFATSLNAPYIETSALSGEGVDELFLTMGKLAVMA